MALKTSASCVIRIILLTERKESLEMTHTVPHKQGLNQFRLNNLRGKFCALKIHHPVVLFGTSGPTLKGAPANTLLNYWIVILICLYPSRAAAGMFCDYSECNCVSVDLA